MSHKDSWFIERESSRHNARVTQDLSFGIQQPVQNGGHNLRIHAKRQTFFHLENKTSRKDGGCMTWYHDVWTERQFLLEEKWTTKNQTHIKISCSNLSLKAVIHHSWTEKIGTCDFKRAPIQLCNSSTNGRAFLGDALDNFHEVRVSNLLTSGKVRGDLGNFRICALPSQHFRGEISSSPNFKLFG